MPNRDSNIVEVCRKFKIVHIHIAHPKQHICTLAAAGAAGSSPNQSEHLPIRQPVGHVLLQCRVESVFPPPSQFVTAMPGVLRFVPCLRPWKSAFVAEPRFQPFVVGQAISKRDGRGSTDAGNPLRGMSPAKLPHSRVCRPWVDVTHLRSPHCPHIFAAHTAHVAGVLELGARLCGGELQHTSDCWRRATCSTMYTLTSSYDTECDNWVKLEYWKKRSFSIQLLSHQRTRSLYGEVLSPGLFSDPKSRYTGGGRLPNTFDKHACWSFRAKLHGGSPS